ncbi:FeoB-associated Cys-rich membrane protein [uncultured Clostridium sp.]|uniref:FeoB-associated Cys-rich membrane protein n=1 Tax=uncultured Clostridium sp. TaxID=59620 RepID=UPI0025FBC560|nr:FeoB-associated Cys-rich membrane protein [uncultured Clostridium sp.]
MIEVLITALIVISVAYIIMKSIKSSSEGKCSGGCSKCHSKSKCSGNSDEK